MAETRISTHPNAGLPNIMGGYDETPAMFAADCAEYMRRGLVDIIGGCCGTTPEHIFELAKIAGDYAPRRLPAPRHITVLSGLEPLRIVPEANFVNIGERTNVAGSAKFARLIREGDYDEALTVARAQVDAGAQLVDVCMDDGLIDGPQAMRHFLNLMASEPEIARVPVMIDSSKWEVLEAGLQVVQGKSVVNSISLKEGEGTFLERAAAIRRYGAAAVVMLFDERGQADTYARKIEVAERAYRLLTEAGFPPEEIVFDPNVLAVATGIEAHDRYALDFIEATRWIKEHLPHAKVSGGVSNLSFAFRGNNAVREAMHSVFLYHAIAAGMDMGIVNPQLLQVYSDIEPALLERVEDVVLCRRADAAERLIDYAQHLRTDTAAEGAAHEEAWRTRPLPERIEYALLRGVTDHIETDTLEAYRELGDPMQVIDRLLMRAMARVGELFGQGKMFLPQVVKSARVMKRAVGVLTPYIEQNAAGRNSAGKVIVATVKGDVHDIGKNIVAVVMACNGYEIRDLGVMVEAQRIVDEAAAWGADAICLSGLITPSLDEMIHVVEEAERRSLHIPFIIGGATTSDLHTAVKIAPCTAAPVIHSRDASENNRILAALLGPDRETYVAEVQARQQPPPASRIADRARSPHGTARLPRLRHRRRRTLHRLELLLPRMGAQRTLPRPLRPPRTGRRSPQTLRRRTGVAAPHRRRTAPHAARRRGNLPRRQPDDILLTDAKGRRHTLPMLRNQTRGAENLCLSDFIADRRDGATDYIGAFALTAGIGLQELCDKFRSEGDDYSAIMAKLLADRLTEAFAEVVHSFVRRQMWGYETAEAPTPQQVIAGEYRGRRMAFGYPASPDHSLKREIFDLLAVEQTTRMRLTENWMISPGEALCGLFFSDAHYFSVGQIDAEQLRDYAERRGLAVETVEKIIPNNV